MEHFIEVHIKDEKRLINLRWVEEIKKNTDGRASIYFAFDQNYTEVDESYSEILSKIWR